MDSLIYLNFIIQTMSKCHFLSISTEYIRVNPSKSLQIFHMLSVLILFGRAHCIQSGHILKKKTQVTRLRDTQTHNQANPSVFHIQRSRVSRPDKIKSTSNNNV